MELGLRLAELSTIFQKSIDLTGVKVDPAIYEGVARAVADAIDQNNKRLAEQLQEMGLVKPN